MLIEKLDDYYPICKLHELDPKLKYFPVINSVISNRQNGLFYIGDKLVSIVHQFGFCYIVKAGNITWEDIKKLNSELGRRIPKLRIYDPHSQLSSIEELKPYRSTRNKYIFDNVSKINLDKHHQSVALYSKAQLETLGLDLSNRFWSCFKDFQEMSFGIVDKGINGICYSAAVSMNYSEVDVFVKDEYRKQGLATSLVISHVNQCLINGITPLWDCYSNNYGSVKLADKVMFRQIFVYDYYNI